MLWPASREQSPPSLVLQIVLHAAKGGPGKSPVHPSSMPATACGAPQHARGQLPLDPIRVATYHEHRCLRHHSGRAPSSVWQEERGATSTRSTREPWTAWLLAASALTCCFALPPRIPFTA